MRYDMAIVGSGAAAFAAALAATRAGAHVVMIERGRLGGTCVNTGCVPSKALLAAAEARHSAVELDRFAGLHAGTAQIDFPKLIAAKDALVTAMRAEKYTEIIDWPVMAGTARFVDGPALQIELLDGGTERVQASHYLVAAGAAPWVPPIPGMTGSGYLTPQEAMALDELPESLIVLGGNAIGLEQAQLFSRLGTRVTVVEALDRLAPFDEPEASQVIAGVFADEGIAVHTAAQVTAVRRDDRRVIVRAGAIELHAQHLLLATGRRPMTAGLGLEAVGVKLGAKGEVLVDERLRTGHPQIYAAGDVTGHPQYVYVAARQGSIAAENALSQANLTVDNSTIPRVTFTSPAIASVGLTQRQAIAAGLRAEARVLPLKHVPRALANRDVRGMFKLVTDAETDRLVGVHAVAEGAGEVIATAAHVLGAGMTSAQLAQSWAPYLTMSEGLKLAAQAFTRDVSKLSCCAA